MASRNQQHILTGTSRPDSDQQSTPSPQQQITQHPTVEMYVRSIEGQVWSVRLPSKPTVLQLKQELNRQTGIPIRMMSILPSRPLQEDEENVLGGETPLTMVESDSAFTLLVHSCTMDDLMECLAKPEHTQLDVNELVWILDHCGETSLMLSASDSSLSGIEALGHALLSNSTIQSLHIKGYSEVRVARVIADALHVSQTLTELSISGYFAVNQLGRSIGVEGARAIADALRVNQTLSTFKLTFNSIGVEGARAIADALRVHYTLTDLRMMGCDVQVEGARAIADALCLNQTLTHLDLDFNSIGAEGAHAVADALRDNYRLTHLSLSKNNIGVQGAIAIANALRINQTLTHIGLEDNKIGIIMYNRWASEGIRAIADALRVNQTLTHIDLSTNSIHPTDRQEIDEVVRSHPFDVNVKF